MTCAKLSGAGSTRGHHHQGSRLDDKAVRERQIRLFRFGAPALIAFSFTSLAPPVLGDGDSWWHVRAGEWMLDHRAVPMTDPFSFTFAGKPWHAHEWLAEVLFATAYRVAGWGGVMLLAGVAAGSTVGLLYEWVRRHVGHLEAFAAAVVAFGCLAPGLLARPHLLALPLLVLWTRALLDARDADRAPSLWWLLLIVVWANLHGSVLLAVALVGPFAVEALVEERLNWVRPLRRWGVFAAGAALATLATPRGLEGVTFLIELTQMQSLSDIVEWRPPDFTRITTLEALLMTGLYLALSEGVRIPPMRVLVLIVLLHMTLQHRRHEMLLALVGVMIWCRGTGRGREGMTEPLREPKRWYLPLVALAFGVVIIARVSLPAGVRETETAPATALAHVPLDLRARPVLNGYASGGFLIGQGVKPFVDGRTDLYGDAFFARYDEIMQGQPGALDQALAEYRIEWTFLPTGSVPARQLDSMQGWRRLYSDTMVTVHVRSAS